jgi:multisubunit Na+/H+ antiporter MnhC subunit
MNANKIISVILFIFSLGAIAETNRILTSNAPDIAENRSSLIPMSLILTAAILYFAIRLWRKGSA